MLLGGLWLNAGLGAGILAVARVLAFIGALLQKAPEGLELPETGLGLAGQDGLEEPFGRSLTFSLSLSPGAWGFGFLLVPVRGGFSEELLCGFPF